MPGIEVLTSLKLPALRYKNKFYPCVFWLPGMEVLCLPNPAAVHGDTANTNGMRKEIEVEYSLFPHSDTGALKTCRLLI